MIWTLRYLSILLWLTASVAIPASFFILPGLTGLFPGVNPFATSIGVAGCSFVLIGWGLDRIVKQVLAGLLKEGQAWERAGIPAKAEKKYIRAVRLFDSFGFLPFAAGRRTAEKLTGIISKFQLNTRVDNPNFKTAVSVYLKMNPQDKETCQLWLRQMKTLPIVSAREQELLSLLADTHAGDEALSVLIADIFLGLERKDFTANKLYGHVRKDPGLADEYSKKIDKVIGGEQEVLADSRQITETSHASKPSPSVNASLQNAAGILMKVTSRAMALILLFCSMGLKGTRSIWKRCAAAVKSILRGIIRGMGYVRDNEQARFYFKAGLLVLGAGWLVYFISGTVAHLFKSKPIEKQAAPIVEHIPKPFTIQVAAYLKQSHADRYVDTLKKKEIDARVKQVGGGGKTWFVVRVSEFADKQSAAAYGDRLKRQNIIDDYFVNNN